LAEASTNSEFSIGPKLPVENATPPEAWLSQAWLSQAGSQAQLSQAGSRKRDSLTEKSHVYGCALCKVILPATQITTPLIACASDRL